MRVMVLLMFVAALSACGQKGGGGGDTKFLIPWHDANGKYELEEVTIETLASPNELRGAAAEVYSHAAFNDSGFNGSIARPHITKSGNLYIPLDTESATAIAVYAQFDRLYKYEQQQKSLSQLNWPRRVGIETTVRGDEIVAHNNAHYFTSLDVIGVVPFTKEGAVPVALNHGILAHEHFHAHFQTQVMNALNRAKPQPIVSALESLFYPLVFEAAPAPKPTTKSPRDLNNLILRAWNEGLADLFAGIFQNQPDFFQASLPYLSDARDLDQEPGKMWMADDVKRRTSEVSTKERLAGLAYEQGTVLARMLYHIANNGTESPQALSSRILAKLPAIAEAFAGTIEAQVMNVEDIVPVLLDGYTVNPAVCAELDSTMMDKATLKRSFAKCGF